MILQKRIQSTSGAEVVAKVDEDGWDEIIINANMTLNAEDALRFSNEIAEAILWLNEQDRKRKKEKEAAKAQEAEKPHESLFFKILSWSKDLDNKTEDLI
jgi:hypothetical protein